MFSDLQSCLFSQGIQVISYSSANNMTVLSAWWDFLCKQSIMFTMKRALNDIFPVYSGLHENSPDQLNTTLHVTFALIGWERSDINRKRKQIVIGLIWSLPVRMMPKVYRVYDDEVIEEYAAVERQRISRGKYPRTSSIKAIVDIESTSLLRNRKWCISHTHTYTLTHKKGTPDLIWIAYRGCCRTNGNWMKVNQYVDKTFLMLRVYGHYIYIYIYKLC